MTWRDRMMAVTWRLERLVIPALRNSHAVYRDTLRSLVAPHTAWLDFGCGHQILATWLRDDEQALVQSAKLVVGVDPDRTALHKHRSLTLRANVDGAELPFPDASFDLITANMVVEHLAEPERQLREFRRVLRPGGLFVFHTPNAQGYTTLLARMVPERFKKQLVGVVEGRAADDVYPTHYRANTPERIVELSRLAGLRVHTIRPLVTSPEFVLFPPIAFFELVWIRALGARLLRRLRPLLLVILEKA